MAHMPMGKYPNYEQWEHVKKPAPATANPFELLNPFLQSWTIGFDHPFRVMEELRKTTKPTYPPYNIVSLEDDKYEIQLAAAGFTKAEIEIEVKEDMLTITGSKDSSEGEYLHKGIAARDFEQKFILSGDMKVLKATMSDGILTISLEREIPEHKKAKKISIK
jgi:molecular chaperone IbpA